MRYLLSDGRYVGQGTPFTFNDIQYPANWFDLATTQDLADLGAQVITCTNERADDRFYTVTESVNGAQVTYVNTPKDLAELKAREVANVNATAYSILLPSDWMVIKAIETGVAIASDWAAWRQEIRDQAATQLDLIASCEDIAALAALAPVQWANNPDFVEPSA